MYGNSTARRSGVGAVDNSVRDEDAMSRLVAVGFTKYEAFAYLIARSPARALARRASDERGRAPDYQITRPHA